MESEGWKEPTRSFSPIILPLPLLPTKLLNHISWLNHLNITRVGDSTTSWGRPFQCLAILWEKIQMVLRHLYPLLSVYFSTSYYLFIFILWLFFSIWPCIKKLALHYASVTTGSRYSNCLCITQLGSFCKKNSVAIKKNTCFLFPFCVENIQSKAPNNHKRFNHFLSFSKISHRNSHV